MNKNTHNNTNINTNPNIKSKENKLEKSYISESPSRKQRKMLLMNQRYNIENIKIKNVNKKINEKINFPGPGI